MNNGPRQAWKEGPSGLAFVPMQRSDIPDVLEIESVSFSNPWREQDFVYALEKEHGIGRVCRLDGLMLGYAVGFRTGSEFHLADFAVRPESQRRGYGATLLDILLAELRMLGFRIVTLEVRRSNQPAVRLYGRAEFQTVAIRRAYYSRPTEDAIVMLKPLVGRLSDWVPKALDRTLKTGESS